MHDRHVSTLCVGSAVAALAKVPYQQEAVLKCGWCQVLVPAPLELIPLLLLPAGRCQAPHRGGDGWVRLRHSRHLAGI